MGTISSHSNELFLSIVSANTSSVTTFNKRGPGEIWTNDGYGNIPTYVSWGDALSSTNDKENANAEYFLGYAIAHEFLHQLLAKAKGASYNGHTDEIGSYSDMPVTGETNLNKSGPYVRDAIPLNWSPDMRPAEKILEQHRKVLLEYFKN